VKGERRGEKAERREKGEEGEKGEWKDTTNTSVMGFGVNGIVVEQHLPFYFRFLGCYVCQDLT
jgi:hypothetical protein